MSISTNRVRYVPYFVNIAGTIVGAASRNVAWELEDREDSTNRLTLTGPLEELEPATADTEIIFDRRRFRVTGVDASRRDGTRTVIADELQFTLSEKVIESYVIQGLGLRLAMQRALSGTGWTVGTIFDESGTFSAEFEFTPVSDVLRFLQNQSEQLLWFDSYAQTVSLVSTAPDPSDIVLTYGAGAANITRSLQAPEFTVIRPVGKDGLTVRGVNAGSEVVEDFGWYESLGLTTQQARARFTKFLYWQDERYIYAANLLRDARAKLATSAYPTINYTIDTRPDLAEEVSLREHVWVVDNTLGVKLSTRVVRIQQTSDRSSATVELSYLPPSFGQTQQEGDSSETTSEFAQFIVKNQSPVTVGQIPIQVLEASIQVYSDATAFQLGLTVRGNLTSSTLPAEINGYLLINGERLDEEIVLTQHGIGWFTSGMPILFPGVGEGTHIIDFMMSTSQGSFEVPLRGATLWAIVRGAFGGVSNTRPDRRVTEHVDSWFWWQNNPQDSATVDIQGPVSRNPSEHVSTWFEWDNNPQENILIWLLPTTAWDINSLTFTLTEQYPGQEANIELYTYPDDVFAEGEQFYADVDGLTIVDIDDQFTLSTGQYYGVFVETGETFGPFFIA